MENYLCPIVDCTSVEYTEDQAWVIVLMAVLLVIGVTFLLGMAIWCVSHGYRGFTGNYSVINWGVNVKFECYN